MAANEIELVWDTFHARIRQYIQKKVSNPDAVEDILQDIFLKIQKNFNKINDETKLEPWVFKIAKYTVIDYYRAKPVQIQPYPDPPAESFEKKFVACQGLKAVKTIIETLPDNYAQILKLSELEKLTASEIASKTGLSLSAVKSRIQRGKSMLNKKLLACCDIRYSQDGGISDIECTKEFKSIKNN